MDAARWPQEVGGGSRPITGERRPRPPDEQALNCPRCNSTNTKFCYYNNYSLSQPRYFCKTCRRYWTAGGSLRNVPVGGGSRKNKRSSSSSTTTTTTSISNNNSSSVPHAAYSASISKKSSTTRNPKFQEGHDLNNLAYPSSLITSDYNHTITNPSSSSSSFMPVPVPVADQSGTAIYSSSSSAGFHLQEFKPSLGLQEFKPSLGFSLAGYESAYGSSFQGAPAHHQESTINNARLFFPFEDHLKQQAPSTAHDQFDQEIIYRGQGAQSTSTHGYWGGM